MNNRFESSTGNWIICFNDDDNVVDSVSSVFEVFSSVIGENREGRIEVSEDVGKRGWLSRFIGLSSRIIQMHCCVEFCESDGSLIFLDEADSEHRAMDSGRKESPSESVLEKISHGEVDALDPKYYMSVDRISQAVKEYLDSGKRPDWLSYVYVEQAEQDGAHNTDFLRVSRDSGQIRRSFGFKSYLSFIGAMRPLALD